VADVEEKKTFVDGNVGGVLIGGVDGALVGVLFPSYVRLATIFLLLHLLLPFLIIVPITITCIWTFRNVVSSDRTYHTGSKPS
jgi:hypothetical protein